jgi:hypothetical protein
MAEVKLFVTEFGETINNIKRLEEELKRLKQVYKDAAVGSDEFNKAQAAGKEVTAILKQQNDALKANTNALGGVNSAAKFAEGSYGRLKQQIKENKDALDKVNTSGKLHKVLLQERIQLENKKQAIEEKIPSLLQKRIQGAIEEANTIKGLREQIKEYSAAVIRGEEGAAQKLAELKDKLDDVKDATNAFKGTGVERLTASMNLLRESVVNVDLDKFKIGLEGLGASMKALPIFLLVDILGRLIEKFGIIDGLVTLVTDAFFALTDALGLTNKQAEKTSKIIIEGLEKQLELVEARYDAEIKLAAAAGKDTEKLELEKLDAIELTKWNELNTLKGLAKKKGELNKEEKEQYDKLQKELVTATGDRAAQEEKIRQLQRKSSKDYYDSLKSSEETLIKSRQSSTQNAIFDLKKERDERLKTLDEQFKTITSYNGINEKALRDHEKAKQNIIDASNIEIGKINSQAAKEKKEKDEKAAQEELKRLKELADKHKELLEGVKRNQDEEISFYETKIAEKKLLNESSVEDEIELENYKLKIVLENENATYEERYKAQVEFDTKMKELDKARIEEQLKGVRKIYDIAIGGKEAEIAELQKLDQGLFDKQFDNLEEQYDIKKEIINLQRQQELVGLDEFSTEYASINAKYAKKEIDLEKQKAEDKKKIRDADIALLGSYAQVAVNIGMALTKDQEKQKQLQKVASLVQIATNTGMAISNLVATSFSALSPDNIMTGGIAAYAKLAAGLVAITSNMAQAKQIVNSFEEGGYTGEGNPHEVSTNLGSKSYTYHKDEYVVPSRVLNTSKGSALAGQLENMRLGMSNPMPHISGMFDGGFTGRSAGMETTNMLENQIMMQKFIESMPNPVVRVTDINKTQGSVQRAVNVSSL